MLPKLKMKNQELNYVKTYKYLAIILDQSLSYNPQIYETIKLTSHKVYQLSIIRKYLTKNAAITIYKSMILPYFDYGDVFLINANQQLLGKIQRIQNRGLQICLGVEARTKTSAAHLSSKVARLADRRVAHLRNYMYKRSQNESYLDKRQVNTRERDAKVFKVFIPKGEAYKQSVLYKGAVEWNNLEVETRNINSYLAFKNKKKIGGLALYIIRFMTNYESGDEK